MLGRAAWEQGLGAMLKVEGSTHALSASKYGVRLLVPKRQEQEQEQKGQELRPKEDGPLVLSEDPGLALDVGVLTVVRPDGGGNGAEEEDDDDEPFVPKGYEAAPPVMLRAQSFTPSKPARPAARPPPSRATRLLRIEHDAPGPYLLREVLVLPRDEPGSGVWVEVEVGGWVFSSLAGQAPALVEADDAPEPLLSGARERGDVLLASGATDAQVSVVAEQDAEGIALRKWLLLRLEGPGVGSPADLVVQHFVVARRLLATVVEPSAASLLSAEAKPFVPQALREWFEQPCGLLVTWPKENNRFMPSAFSAFLKALPPYMLEKKIKDKVAKYRAACVAQQQQHGTDAPPPDPYEGLGIHRTDATVPYLGNLGRLVDLEEIQAEQDMSRYDLFSVPLHYKPPPAGLGEGQAPPPLVTTITVPGAAENRPPLAYGDTVRLRPAAPDGPMLEVRAAVLDRKEERVRLLLPPEFPAESFPPGSRWHVRFCYERVAYRFLYAGLYRLSVHSSRPNAERFLSPTPEPGPAPPPVVGREEEMGWINPLVNEEQKAAVMAIVNGAHGKAPFCLYGPPGTGKTLTLIEAILQVCRHVPGAKVLAVAPSDVAADIICERLAQRLRPTELFRLNWYSRRFESMKVSLLSYSCWDSEAGAFSLPNDPDPLTFIQQRQVVVCTCAASGLLALVRRPGRPPLSFSHIFVDESSQALQPEVLVPLSLASHETSVVRGGGWGGALRRDVTGLARSA
jgi:hypothetical protein